MVWRVRVLCLLHLRWRGLGHGAQAPPAAGPRPATAEDGCADLRVALSVARQPTRRALVFSAGLTWQCAARSSASAVAQGPAATQAHRVAGVGGGSYQVIAQARRHVADTPHALLQGQHTSLARCLAAGMQEAAQHAEPQPTPAADIAPDVAEAAAAAAFELPVHPIQPLPVAPAQATAAAEAHESDARSDDDGFEFGSDAASDSSSSWTSSDEETGDPLTSASLPAWLARRTAGGRCAMRLAAAVLCRHSPRRVA